MNTSQLPDINKDPRCDYGNSAVRPNTPQYRSSYTGGHSSSNASFVGLFHPPTSDRHEDQSRRDPRNPNDSMSSIKRSNVEREGRSSENVGRAIYSPSGGRNISYQRQRFVSCDHVRSSSPLGNNRVASDVTRKMNNFPVRTKSLGARDVTTNRPRSTSLTPRNKLFDSACRDSFKEDDDEDHDSFLSEILPPSRRHTHSDTHIRLSRHNKMPPRHTLSPLSEDLLRSLDLNDRDSS